MAAKLEYVFTGYGFIAVIAPRFRISLGSIWNAYCRWPLTGFLYGLGDLSECLRFWINLVRLALFGLHRMAWGGIGNIIACSAKLSWDSARLHFLIYD